MWDTAAQRIHSLGRTYGTAPTSAWTLVPHVGHLPHPCSHPACFQRISDSWTASHLAAADVTTELLHFSSVIHHSPRVPVLERIQWAQVESKSHPQGVTLCGVHSQQDHARRVKPCSPEGWVGCSYQQRKEVLGGQEEPIFNITSVRKAMRRISSGLECRREPPL